MSLRTEEVICTDRLVVRKNDGTVICEITPDGVTGNVTGDVTGNVTGDVTGNVTGNVTGDLTGNVVGNVTGDLTGNVAGEVTGNVTTDTIAEETPGSGVSIDGAAIKDGAIKGLASSATGALVAHFGKNASEGLTIKCLEEVVACSAIENALTNPIPKGAIILAVLANADAALTGGGTTATWSVGVTGAVDKYGTAGFPTQADSLAQNSKSNFLQNLDTAARLAADETLKVIGTVTGGATAGDTALTVGSVRVQVIFMHWDALEDAA